MTHQESSGSRRKLTDEQERQLTAVIVNKQPADVGFEARHTWTLAIIAAWINREFDEAFTEKGVSKMLARLGFRYTKATYTLAKADATEKAQFREETLPSLKQQLLHGEINHLLFEDESMIRDYLALQYNWFERAEAKDTYVWPP